MRRLSRKSLVLAMGALVSCSLWGLGCQTARPGGTGTTSFGPSSGNGMMGARADSPGLVRAGLGYPEQRSGESHLTTLAVPKAPERLSPAGNETVRPVVWRASSRSLHGDESTGIELASARCAPSSPPSPPLSELPKELDKITMPPHRIEPPDILLIDVFRIVPKPPYRLEPLDELLIQAPKTEVVPKEPIDGIYMVDAEGRIDLGFSYGKVEVRGLTVEETAEKVKREFERVTSLRAPRLVVSLTRTRGFQQVRGEHLVRPDGTLSLGIYGDVYVAGKTLDEARQAIVAQLSHKLLNPEVTVDVAVYNSKVYYVIFDGGGLGQQIMRLPVVGGETVLDAIAQVSGIPAGSSDKRIWVARPVPGGAGFRQILPVDWQAITEGAATNTNYQLFPGDRIYVKADHWIAFNNKVNKLLSPFERMFGFMLLGNAAVRAVGGQQGGLGGGGGF